MTAKAELGPLYGIVLPILIEVSLAPGSYCFSAPLAPTDSSATMVASNAVFAFGITFPPVLPQTLFRSEFGIRSACTPRLRGVAHDLENLIRAAEMLAGAFVA